MNLQHASMAPIWRIVVYLIGSSCLCGSTLASDTWATPAELRNKKLIECGHGNRWTGITPQWMAEHPEIMSIYPFDGITLRIYLDPEWCRDNDIDPEVVYGKTINNQRPFLATLCMSGEYNVPDWAVQNTIDAYKQVEWGSLTDNFLDWSLRHNSTAFADLNDDTQWQRVLNNARLMGKVAAECGFKGLWFDTEDYDGPPFEGYEPELVKRRGMQWIRALQAELPDPVIIFTFVYDDSNYAARFKHFMDGVLAGMAGNGRLVNAYENSFYYGWSDGMPRGPGGGWGPIAGDRAKFSDTRDKVIHEWRNLSDDPERYNRYVEVGMAAWWDAKENLTPGQPTPYAWGNMPLALAYSDEYVWHWNEFTNYYHTLPIGKLDPRVASITNMTFNQGTERVSSLDFDFSTNPLLNSNGWYFDFDPLDHDPNHPYAFAELPYNWSESDQALVVRAYRRGTQRNRYVHPVKGITQASDFRASFTFQIDSAATDPDNVMLLGLFNADFPDHINSVTFQVWGLSHVKVQCARQTKETITIEPELTGPLTTGQRCELIFLYTAEDKTLRVEMYEQGEAERSLFKASTTLESLGGFSLNEFGIALWNADNTTSEQATAWEYRIHRAQLSTQSE